MTKLLEYTDSDAKDVQCAKGVRVEDVALCTFDLFDGGHCRSATIQLHELKPVCNHDTD